MCPVFLAALLRSPSYGSSTVPVRGRPDEAAVVQTYNQHCLATKRNLIAVATGMDLEGVTLSDMSQSERDK